MSMIENKVWGLAMGSDTVNFSIVPRNDGKEVLLVPSGAGWSLPSHQHTNPPDISTELTRTLGVDSVVTGTVEELTGPGGQSTVFAHQNIGATESLPDSARWIGRAELDGTDLAVRELREVLENWFDGGDSLPRVPWCHDGWFADAASWMIERLHEHELDVTGPVEQFLISPWSCTLRVPTGDGFAYLKAAPKVFGHEADLTRTLAEWFPDNIVPVLAVDSERSWMLSTDIGPCTFIDPVTTRDDLPAYLRSTSRYVDIQKRALSELRALDRLGVPDLRLTALPALFDDMVADTSVLMVGEQGGLSVEEHERLVGFATEFRERCAGLAEFSLPETLVNVDFWHGNISFRASGDIIFDWAETAIAHPMFSLTTVIREFVVNDLPDGDELRDALVGNYLAQWRDHESDQRIRDAYRLAQPGAILCRAQCWRDSISSLTEPQRYPTHQRAVVVNMSRMLPFID